MEIKLYLLRLFLLYYSRYKEFEGQYNFEQIDNVELLERESESIPSNVKDSVDYYIENVEDNDWGVVRLYGITRNEVPEFLYLVKVSTDGDDGWLELFHNNNRLVAARTYLELLYFMNDVDELRSYCGNLDKLFPDNFEISSTIWHTPLPWNIDDYYPVVSVDYENEMINWLHENNAIIHSDIEIKNISDNERGVFIVSNIAKGSLLLSIPKRCLLSVELAKSDCELCRRLVMEEIETGDELDLSAPQQNYLALYILETVKNPSHFFAKYYSTLPKSFPNFPIYWSSTDLSLLEGSALSQFIKDRKVSVEADYAEIKRIIPDMNYTYDEYLWARSVVVSRNFGVTIDGMKTEILVPYADMLNHKRPRQSIWTYDEDTESFVINSLADLAGGEQLFDSYGKKSNARYLLNYGFTVEDNRDRIDGTDEYICYNDYQIFIELNQSDSAINIKKNLFGERLDNMYHINEKYKTPWGCLTSITSDWNDPRSREAISLARFRFAKGKELLKLPVLTDDVDLQKTIIPPLSLENELDTMGYIASLCMESLRLFSDTDFSAIYNSTSNIRKYLDSLRREIAGIPVGSNMRNAKVLILGEKEILLGWIDFYNNIKYITDRKITAPSDVDKSNASLYRYYNTVLLPLMAKK